jgi:hypothetical protein
MRMNRVTKKFFGKIWQPFAIMAYIFVVCYLATMTKDPLTMALIAGVCFTVPLLYVFFKQAYKDAKWEVEQENQMILNKIKGE